MSSSIDNLRQAMQKAAAIRPKVGGFPYLAETLRRAGVTRNIMTLPSCQALYLTTSGNVVSQGTNLVNGLAEIPDFDQEALIAALRADQEGKSVFPEFLAFAWRAGVVRYEVDFEKRNVTYFGADGRHYVEDYPAVDAMP